MKKVVLVVCLILGVFVILNIPTNKLDAKSSMTEEQKQELDNKLQAIDGNTSVEETFSLLSQVDLSFLDKNSIEVDGHTIRAIYNRERHKYYYVDDTNKNPANEYFEGYIKYDDNNYLAVELFQEVEHGYYYLDGISLDIYAYDPKTELLISNSTQLQKQELDYISDYVHITGTLPKEDFKYINYQKVQELSKQIVLKIPAKPLTKESKGVDPKVLTLDEFMAMEKSKPVEQ